MQILVIFERFVNVRAICDRPIGAGRTRLCLPAGSAILFGMKKRGKKEGTFTGSETKRFIGAITEQSQHYVSAVSEQFLGVNKKLDAHTEMVADLVVRMTQVELNTSLIKEEIVIVKKDMTVMKEDIKSIKANSGQKTDRKEFPMLGRRVSVLEQNVANPKY